MARRATHHLLLLLLLLLLLRPGAMSSSPPPSASASLPSSSSCSPSSTCAASSNCAAAAALIGIAATLPLNDGRRIPAVGLGVYQSEPGQETYSAVLAALALGYRHIDTAHLYQNERDVGRAVRDSGVPRGDIFITTKLWAGFNGEPEDGYAHAIAAGLDSEKKLGTYIDLYLIHSPAWRRERVNAWLGLEELRRRGVAKSIGVSNYGVHHLEELLGDARTEVVPAVNQIELHVFLRHDAIVAACRERGIVIEAYSPLAKARRLADVPVRPVLMEGAGAGDAEDGGGGGVGGGDAVERAPPSAAQVMLKWGLQKGFVVLPKSVHPKRIAENADVFGWALSDEAMAELDALGDGFSTGWDPTVWD
jgi:diketogulonate reductase-like aldo/keto reductase